MTAHPTGRLAGRVAIATGAGCCASSFGKRGASHCAAKDGAQCRRNTSGPRRRVGETFPLKVRAVAISIFYALGTGVGGIAGPAVFGRLIQTGSHSERLIGYLLGGGLMVGAAVVEWMLGVDAERRSLEEVAPPLSSA